MEGYFALDQLLGQTGQGRALIKDASKAVADALEAVFGDDQLPDAKRAEFAQEVFDARMFDGEAERQEQDAELVLACLEAVDRKMPCTGIVMLGNYVIKVDPYRSYKSQAAFLMFSCVNDLPDLPIRLCQHVVDFIARQSEQTLIRSESAPGTRVDKYMASPLIEIATHCEARLHANQLRGVDISVPRAQMLECMTLLARSSKGLMELHESKANFLSSRTPSPEYREAFIRDTLDSLFRVAVDVSKGSWQFRSGLKNMLTDLVALGEAAASSSEIEKMADDPVLVRRMIIDSLKLDAGALSAEMMVLPFGSMATLRTQNDEEVLRLLGRLNAVLGDEQNEHTRLAYTHLLAGICNTLGAQPSTSSNEWIDNIVGSLYARTDADLIAGHLNSSGRDYIVGYVMRNDPSRGRLYGLREKSAYIGQAFGL